MYNHPQVAITEEEFVRRQEQELLRSLHGTAQGTAQVPADTLDANIVLLKTMGYIESDAREALQATSGGVGNAIDWLLEKAEAGDTTTAIAAADKFAAEAEAEDTTAAIAAAEKFAAEEEAAFKAQLEAMVQSDTGYGTGYGPGDKSPPEWTWSGPPRMTPEEMEHLPKAPAPEPAPEATSVAPTPVTPVTPEQAEIIEYIKTQKILQDYVSSSSTGEKINTFRGFLYMAKLYDYKDLPLMDTLTLQGVVDDSEHIDTAFLTSLGILKEFHHKRFLRQLIILTEDGSPEVGLRITDTSRMLGHLTLAEKLLIVEHIKNNETIQVKDEPPLIMQLLPGDVIEAALDKAELKETFEGKLLIAQLLNIKARRQTHFHDSETIFREAIDLLNSIGDMSEIQVIKRADILWRLQGNLAMSQIAQKKYEDAEATLRDISMTCAGASNIPNCEARKNAVKSKMKESNNKDAKEKREAKYGHIAEGLTPSELTKGIEDKKVAASDVIQFVEFLLDYLPDNLKKDTKIGSDKFLKKLKDPKDSLSLNAFVKRMTLLFHGDKYGHSKEDLEKGGIITRYLTGLNQESDPRESYPRDELEGLEEEIKGLKKDLETFIKQSFRGEQGITDEEVNPNWVFTVVEGIQHYAMVFKQVKQINLEDLTHESGDRQLENFMNLAIDGAVELLINDYLAEPREGIFKEESGGGGKEISPKRRKTQKRTKKRKTKKRKTTKKTRKKKKRSTKRKRR